MLKLKTLIQSRNKFVCMQLVTMAQEQHTRVKQALESGDSTAVHKAQFTYLSTLEASQELVAAAIFYPRASSKDGANFPHAYVELICCCAPGRGYGTLLLQHIEQFVKQHHELLSEAFAHEEAPSTIPATIYPNPAQSMGLHQPSPAKTLTIKPVVPQPPPTAAAPPGALAAGDLQPWAVTQQAAAGNSSLFSMGLKPTPPPAPAPVQQQQQQYIYQQQQQKQQAEIMLTSELDTLSISSSTAQPQQLIQGIKLLSVESAMAFYMRNGYSEPDACREMFKSLQDL